MPKNTDRDIVMTPFPNWVNRHAPKHTRPAPMIGNEDDPIITRQEFKDEADINNLVARMLRGMPVPMGTPQYGEIDYTTDLQGAYAMADQLVQTYNELPDEVKQGLTRTEFVTRLANGEQLDAFTSREEPVAPTQQDEKTPEASA